MVEGYVDLLIDILERVNRDEELVRDINHRVDLGYPDLRSALTLAHRIKEHGDG